MASDAPKINPGDILHWPILKITYRTDPEKIAALLPPGIDPGAEPNVHCRIYCVPVPDEPEYGVVISVDADYRGTPGTYTLGLGIDQESAIFISKRHERAAEVPLRRSDLLSGRSIKVSARCHHQGYTFLEFEGTVAGEIAERPDYTENEWWVKVSRAVGGAEKSYDFPPHVVHVKSQYGTQYRERVEGTLSAAREPLGPGRHAAAAARAGVGDARHADLRGPQHHPRRQARAGGLLALRRHDRQLALARYPRRAEARRLASRRRANARGARRAG